MHWWIDQPLSHWSANPGMNRGRVALDGWMHSAVALFGYCRLERQPWDEQGVIWCWLVALVDRSTAVARPCQCNTDIKEKANPASIKMATRVGLANDATVMSCGHSVLVSFCWFGFCSVMRQHRWIYNL